MTSDRDIFLKAIDVLEERGWAQGCWKDADGSVCLLGAILEVRGHTLLTVAERSRWDRAIGVTPSIPIWNDAPERTYEDVILALKRAAHGEAAVQ